MASITVRNLDEDLKRRLKEQAAKHGCSMEEEVRRILAGALPELAKPDSPGTARELYENIRRIVEPLGGIELELPPRHIKCPNPCCNESETPGLE